MWVTWGNAFCLFYSLIYHLGQYLGHSSYSKKYFSWVKEWVKRFICSLFCLKRKLDAEFTPHIPETAEPQPKPGARNSLLLLGQRHTPFLPLLNSETNSSLWSRRWNVWVTCASPPRSLMAGTIRTEGHARASSYYYSKNFKHRL